MLESSHIASLFEHEHIGYNETIRKGTLPITNWYSEFGSVEQGDAESESSSKSEVPEEESVWYTADPNATAVSNLQNENNVLARGV